MAASDREPEGGEDRSPIAPLHHTAIMKLLEASIAIRLLVECKKRGLHQMNDSAPEGISDLSD